MYLSSVFLLCLYTIRALATQNADSGQNPLSPSQHEKNPVTWDEHSLFVYGERLLILSGEFHPWRLPVPGLWLDVFQKMNAAGFNAVSFYVLWVCISWLLIMIHSDRTTRHS